MGSCPARVVGKVVAWAASIIPVRCYTLWYLSHISPPLRYHGLKEQRDSKSHEAEMVEMRMKESTHHQQLAHLQELKDTIGEYMVITQGINCSRLWLFNWTEVCYHALKWENWKECINCQTLIITECVTLLYIAKQKETVKQSVAMEKSARAKLKEIQQKMKDSKSHHERELKEAEASITRAKKEAESVVKEAKSREQEMQALTLEVEELQKGLEVQQGQVSSSESL